jgi:hypothetical protein
VLESFASDYRKDIILKSTSKELKNFYLNLCQKYLPDAEIKELDEDKIYSLCIKKDSCLEIMQDYSLKENYLAVYLSGAFIAKGSVNDPNTTKYHFEIGLSNAKYSTVLLSLFNEFDLNMKIIKRRSKYVLYIKDAEKIVDTLRMLGAENCAFRFEDIRIQRDFNNSINRLMNCEIANEQKSLASAQEQLKQIKYLEYNYPLEKIDKKTLTIMKVRKDNPEANFVELISILENDYGIKISKPGLSHRFNKIKNLVLEDKKNKKN